MDWDYLEENYTSSDNKVRSLDEIMKECEANGEISDNLDSIYSDKAQLEKTVNDVKNVRELIHQGITVKEISKRLALDEDYVVCIAVTLNSSTDDDNDIAIAHLVMME
jgi:hypothetical protein